ncbi:hypothetical protein FRC08_008360 [Ceratobasidium sp. 394]|nr:hypothetical protein FRC08_008360 [Ceratobasidium sp. 394]
MPDDKDNVRGRVQEMTRQTYPIKFVGGKAPRKQLATRQARETAQPQDSDEEGGHHEPEQKNVGQSKQ